MNPAIPISLLRSLQITNQKEACQLLPNGLINQTWFCKSPLYPSPIVLQQINTDVFKNPLAVINNHRVIHETWLANHATHSFKIAAPLPFPDNKMLYLDSIGSTWRLQEFIDNTYSLTKPSTSTQLYNAASCFGEFGKIMQAINCQALSQTLENFHNLRYRYQQFQTALATGNTIRIQEAAILVKHLKNRISYVEKFDSITGSPQDFPLRIRHHDAKTANLLFEKSSNKIAAILDLDTTMPGYFFSDLGDMIRSMAGKTDENHTNWEEIVIDEDAYNAILNGYQSAMENYATKSENAFIHWSGVWIIYMQCLRFITDYFLDDTYYKIAYARQNWDRAWNQFYLLTALEEHLQNKFNFIFP
ncbi:MAG: phosphotransferase [Bacteroidetes bacterium]|nr:phosphotransferase [Bacteroidota bacterium]